MRKMLLSLAALMAVSVGAVGASQAAPLGTMIGAPRTESAARGDGVQAVQYRYHHRRHWHHRHHGY